MAFGYPRSDQPQHYIDYNKCTPVTVMINFAPDGKMLPIYLRWTYPDKSEETIKIDGVKYTKDIEGGISYCCLVTMRGWQKQIILTYYVMEHVWVMEK